MLLLVARHGETEGNREKRFQGHQDYPLNSRGEEQAIRLGTVLEDFKPRAVLASDLARAKKTALLAAGSLGVPMCFHPLVREYNFGILEGCNREEIFSLYPSLKERLQDGYLEEAPPGGEEMACFARRLQSTRHYFAAFPRGDCCLLVSHGRFINAFLTLLIAGSNRPPYRFPVSNASLSAVALRGSESELLFFNDTCHLEKEHVLPYNR